MKKRTATIVLPALTLLAIGNAPSKPAVLFDEMHGHVAPQAQIVWDVTNAITDDDGKPVAAKMKPADWAKLQAAASQLNASFSRLANASSLKVVRPGGKIQDEDSPTGTSAAKVQAIIKAQPEAFRQSARSFAALARGIAVAAGKRDIGPAYAATAQMDSVCEACHVTFWYPDQKS